MEKKKQEKNIGDNKNMNKSLKQGMKNLAEELRERIFRDEEISGMGKIKKQEEDLTDKEIQELSEKITEKDIQEEKKNVEKKETLIPLEDYIKCAVHLGTKVITPHMRKFVYKRRADGLAVINTAIIDDKIREAVDFLINYNPEQVYLLCKREAGWIPAEKFQEATGIKVFTKKYTPGITTNLILENFFESDLTIICDPWTDKNALFDTIKLKKPVLALCDTNNFTKGITKIIPCNNKSRKSVGCILYLLAREYCKKRNFSFNFSLKDFAGELE